MIEIKQRRKCGYCRAFSGGMASKCSLGYALKNGTITFGIITDGIPLEPCPKPLQVNHLVECSQNYRR